MKGIALIMSFLMAAMSNPALAQQMNRDEALAMAQKELQPGQDPHDYLKKQQAAWVQLNDEIEAAQKNQARAVAVMSIAVPAIILASLKTITKEVNIKTDWTVHNMNRPANSPNLPGKPGSKPIMTTAGAAMAGVLGAGTVYIHIQEKDIEKLKAAIASIEKKQTNELIALDAARQSERSYVSGSSANNKSSTSGLH